jgi:hypothetical protein
VLKKRLIYKIVTKKNKLDDGRKTERKINANLSFTFGLLQIVLKVLRRKGDGECVRMIAQFDPATVRVNACDGLHL